MQYGDVVTCMSSSTTGVGEKYRLVCRCDALRR